MSRHFDDQSDYGTATTSEVSGQEPGLLEEAGEPLNNCVRSAFPPQKPFGNDTQSLSRQISQAASRLNRRKRTITALGSSLRSRIRSGFTSPGGLLIAGCTGFLAAEWIHRPMNDPRPAREQPSKSPRRSQTAAMANAALVWKFAQDLGTLWAKANSGVRQRTDERRSQEHAVNEPGY